MRRRGRDRMLKIMEQPGDGVSGLLYDGGKVLATGLTEDGGRSTWRSFNSQGRNIRTLERLHP
jgi:hypothetical protein